MAAHQTKEASHERGREGLFRKVWLSFYKGGLGSFVVGHEDNKKTQSGIQKLKFIEFYF